MKYWATSDTHFGHTKLTTIFNERPVGFEDLIIKGLGCVAENDVLFHLGDISVCSKQETTRWLSLFPKCTKILILGNHDDYSKNFYYDNGFSLVLDTATLTINGMNIILSHEPVIPCDYDMNVHGHMHGNGHRVKNERGEYNCMFVPWKTHFDVGTNVHDYKPVDLFTINYFCKQKLNS